MSALTDRLRDYVNGKATPAEVVAVLARPRGRRSDPQQRDPEDPVGQFPQEGTFEEISSLYGLGRLSDDQYRELHAAVKAQGAQGS